MYTQTMIKTQPRAETRICREYQEHFGENNPCPLEELKSFIEEVTLKWEP